MTDNILIIESEPVLKGELVSVFTKAGFTVDNVPDYPEALLKLVKLGEFKPNIIIADTGHMDADAWTACSELHQVFDVALILIGRDSRSEAWERAMEAGADFYLTKPFSYMQLVARVKAILRRYKKLQQNRGEQPSGGKDMDTRSSGIS